MVSASAQAPGKPASNNANQVEQFGYDHLDRLSSWSSPGGGTIQYYGYDQNGNRNQLLSGISNYANTVDPASNRLLGTTGPPPARSFTYDATGNMTGNGESTFTYDARGRMTGMQRGTLSVNYLVNGLGQRVAKTGPANVVPTGAVYFFYDERGRLLGEYDASGNAIQEYVWRDSELMMIMKGDSNYFLDSDHLLTPRAVTNPAGQFVWRWESDPFGVTPPNQDPDGDGVPFTLNLRFPGQYFDIESGLHYNYFRDYDPQTGRYVQSDPIGLRGGINTYTYVNANPLSYTDPTGRSPLGIALGLGVLAFSSYQGYQSMNQYLDAAKDIQQRADEKRAEDVIRSPAEQAAQQVSAVGDAFGKRFIQAMAGAALGGVGGAKRAGLLGLGGYVVGAAACYVERGGR